jgi:hypothetical protein
MITITEGQVNRTTSDVLLYPGINSCLTITCFCEGPLIVGGHAILVADAPLKDINAIMDYIVANAPPTDRTHLVLIGDTGTWDDNMSGLSRGEYSSLEALGDKLGLPASAHKMTIQDVVSYTNRGKNMVRVMASAIGFCQIWTNDGKTQLKMIPIAWRQA